MPSNRHTRLVTALLALLSLLFMQLAVAGYACPGKAGQHGADMAVMAEAGMPCAETMALAQDDEQPGLCQAHCKADSQSAERYQPPLSIDSHALPVAYLMTLAVPVLAVAPLQIPHLKRTTAPPLAIRHCCLRL